MYRVSVPAFLRMNGSQYQRTNVLLGRLFVISRVVDGKGRNACN